MHSFNSLLTAAVAVGGVAADNFNLLRHVGGNGQWFPGPEVTGISSEVPAGCKVDMVASFSRHGSRYPDTGAYNGWVDLQKRLQAAGPFNVTDEKLEFLKTWKPVLSDPAKQIGQISTTGYKELHEMGSTWRLRYPDLYEYNAPFTMWANYYTSGPRVRDSARLFAQGFVGPNATDLTTIYALNASDPRAWQNSLGASDLCKAYSDNGGSPYTDEWNAIYLPPIRQRLQAQIKGSFNLTLGDLQSIPYLCGFETQITGRRSPFCDILTEAEALGYEYAQDLRYWYGTGLGTDIEKYQMLPTVDMVLRRFLDGPNAVYTNGNTSFAPPAISVAFSNDGQINQILSAIGVFDNEPQLPGNMTIPDRKFRSSRFVTMRGTVAFERLNCSAAAAPTPSASPAPCSSNSTYANAPKSTGTNSYMRIRLNDVVYPVAGCTSGPGSSCPLTQYKSIVDQKLAQAGDFKVLCNDTNPAFTSQPRSTYFMNNTLPWGIVVKP